MLELPFNLVGGGKAQVYNKKNITKCQELPQVGGLFSNKLCIQRIQRKPRIERTIPRATVIRVQTCLDKQRLHFGLRRFLRGWVGVAGGSKRAIYGGCLRVDTMKHKN